MKKIKFAAQVIILAASFPVLFVAGISHHSSKTTGQPGIEQQDSPVIKKAEPAGNCLCKLEKNNPKKIS